MFTLRRGRLKFDAAAGHGLKTAVTEALELARVLQQPVEFAFNCITLRVEPGDDAEKIFADFKKMEDGDSKAHAIASYLLETPDLDKQVIKRIWDCLPGDAQSKLIQGVAA